MKIRANRNSWDIIECREYELIDQNECYCCVVDECGEDNWYPKRYFEEVIHKKVFDNPEGYLFKLGNGELAVALNCILNSNTYYTNIEYGYSIVTEKCLKDGSFLRIEDDNCITGYITDWNYKTLKFYEEEQYDEKCLNDTKIVAYKNCGSINKAIITMLGNKEIEWDFKE